MSKDLRIRIFSFVLAALLSALGTFNTFSSITYAASSSSWDDLGEDAISLRDAYLRYFNGWCSGSVSDIIGGAIDVPVSWFKTLSDGTKAISPVDDWYFYLTDGDDLGGSGGRVHSGGGGSHSDGVHLASEVAPVLPAESLKEAASYWADYYKPMPTKTQYTFSYQTESFCSSSPYDFPRFAPIYMDTNGSWGKKNWSSVYIIPFLKDDDTTFYSSNFFHIYASRDSGSLRYYIDSFSLISGNLVKSFSSSWDIDDYPYLGFVCKSGKSNSQTVMIGKWPSHFDYLANTNGIGYMNYYDIGDMISVNNSVSTLSLSNMRSATSFTPHSNLNDDWGFILSAEPFELVANQTSIDFDKIPDNYYITVNGDTIYDYDITNPDTGDTSTINQYITNNYYLPDNGGSGNSGDTNNIWNIDFPDFITNITTSIETAITNVFVADETVINNYNQEIQDTFNEKLPFVSDFGDILDSFFVEIVDNNFVYAGDINKASSDEDGSDSGGSVREEYIIYPKWEVDISYFGKDMTLTILDFSMYAEPLYYVRIIACIFIYLIYFVNLMKYLPTLIGNVADMSGRVSSYANPSKPKSGGDE